MADGDPEAKNGNGNGNNLAVEDAAGSSRSIGSRTSQSPRPQHHRMDSLKRSVSAGVKRSQSAVAHWLGVEQMSEEESDDRQAMWQARRVTMGRRFGAKPKPSPHISTLMENDVTDSPDVASGSRPAVNPILDDIVRVWKKPSVAEMAWRKVARKAVSAPSQPRAQPSLRRLDSFPPHVIEEMPDTMADLTIKHELFFDRDLPGVVEQPLASPPAAFKMAVNAFQSPGRKRSAVAVKAPMTTETIPAAEAPLLSRVSRAARPELPKLKIAGSLPATATGSLPASAPGAVAPLAVLDEEETDHVGVADVLANVIKPPTKSRIPGMDFMSRFFGGHGFRRKQPVSVQEQMYELLDHRPYFTYWVTIVQTLILIVSVAVYGFAPVGFDHKQQSSLILETSLALETVDYLEPENFWLGPRANHLIHLGAKYAPCMRPDDKIGEQIAADRASENETACCVRNDGSGCVQSTLRKCSKTMATFYKFPNKHEEHRVSGSVCGLDPHYCSDPPSVGPHTWPDDITRWPICKKKANVSIPRAAPHMSCEVVGHPCCTGTRGECQISTREYCDFVQGYFHEDALLCSQVSCMDKICGMLPFLDPEVPDQFYRLWTAIFLHAGFIHLLITLVFQYVVMRDAEKLTGFVRMGIIYIMSGVGGNLASAIFTPYVAEVGPSGSQFGVFACVFVEIIYSWKLLDRPWMPVLRMSLMVLFLFIVGLFPWTDNYAHIFGFAFGFLLSLALLPGLAFGESNRRCKVWTIILALLACIGLFAGLIVMFYVHPIYDCVGCSYLNCIPITENFCDNQKIVIAKKPTD
ncbi:Inactive rhomboid protein 1 [Hypsibius exemplaris]|uniref:Inactive rhomboid protein 1 n=1 Tax=Hypsibius exemplaris TaxID=2072580 RepID=A0A1W0WPI9_HYPEX|nr:Inactive rhomboid protein 1 [Hypsibius exemplaris]